jgi:hypothetical protein
MASAQPWVRTFSISARKAARSVIVTGVVGLSSSSRRRRSRSSGGANAAEHRELLRPFDVVDEELVVAVLDDHQRRLLRLGGHALEDRQSALHTTRIQGSDPGIPLGSHDLAGARP